MTTITYEQLQAILQAPCTDTRNAALADAGITIAPPEPPEAMVKLAREIVAAFAQDAASGVREGGWDNSVEIRIALAALQHADKAIDEAVAELAGTTASLKPHNLYGAFKRKIGAA